MNYKPSEEDLMSWLYGECDAAEREQIEQYLVANPEERARLQGMKAVRAALRNVHDKEVIAPPIALGETPSPVRQLWQSGFVRTAVGIAAALLIVMVGARLTGTIINVGDGELRISFGTPQARPQAQTLSAQQVQDLIDASLASNNKVMTASLDNSRVELEQSIRASLANSSRKMNDAMKTISTASQDQVRTFVAGMRDENLKAMQDYLKLTSNEQNKYVEGLLVDFSKYLQEQRQSDLRMFQTKINSVEKNTDQFKQETEQILAGIISNGSSRRQTTY